MASFLYYIVSSPKVTILRGSSFFTVTHEVPTHPCFYIVQFLLPAVNQGLKILNGNSINKQFLNCVSF